MLGTHVRSSIYYLYTFPAIMTACLPAYVYKNISISMVLLDFSLTVKAAT